MKSPFYFVVKPKEGKRYSNNKDVGGVSLITSTSIENHLASNREGVVEELPAGYEGPVSVGDTLLVHHNVFKTYYDMKGNERSGRSFLKDDLFFVDDEQFYMYKSGGRWKTHSKYCFVEPIDKKDSLIYKPGREEPLVGVVRYGNDKLDALGVHEGDEVIFEPETEYEFQVDDRKMYRMFVNNIVAKL